MEKLLLIANWKMHLTRDAVTALTETYAQAMSANPSNNITMVVCPSFPYLGLTADIIKRYPHSSMLLGAQDCHDCDRGPYTGEVSPLMLAEFGCSYVILGHSERRHHENQAQIKRKLKAALEHDLIPVLCVGDNSSNISHIIANICHDLEQILTKSQTIKTLVVSYEPLFAIGTGKIPELSKIKSVTQGVERFLQDNYAINKLIMAYGGSVTQDNIHNLQKNTQLNSFLIGGASMDADKFLPVITATTSTTSLKRKLL